MNLVAAAKSVRPKVLGAKPKQAGKKEGGLGVIPTGDLPKGENSAFPLLNQNEASSATCLNTWKAGHHRKILFSLREKEIWRPKFISALLFVTNRSALGQTRNAQIEKSQIMVAMTGIEPVYPLYEGDVLTIELHSLFEIILLFHSINQKSYIVNENFFSDVTQKLPSIPTFCLIFSVVSCML